MRDFLKLSGRWLATGWIWPLALLALPNCMFNSEGLGVSYEFDPGPSPASSAIMCEFPKPRLEGVSQCATPEDVEAGMSIAEAAVALAEGRSKTIALDFSDAAIKQCNGMPIKTEFLEGTFPDGSTVCLNCGTQIPSVFASPTAACVAKCRDLIYAGNIQTGGEEVTKYCEANARTATNYDSDICFDGACTNGGNPLPPESFFDPRRHQEKVKWIDESTGIKIFGADNNSLARIAMTTGPGDGDFNEGAASGQLITKGDAWVEFEAGVNQTNLSHVIGLRESCDNINDCKDEDRGLTGIGFALSLNNDGNVYVLEKGNPLVVVPILNPSTYSGSERFRVRATDNNDGTATITYHRVAPGCVDGTPCATQLLHTSPTLATYPLRVDAIFREQGASLEHVTIVRIKQ